MSIHQSQRSPYRDPSEGAGVLVVLGLVAGGLYLGYLFLTGVLWPSLQLVPQVLAGMFRTVFVSAAWEHILWSVLFGMAVGLIIGLLRYVLKVRSKVVRGLVAQLGQDSVSAYQIGFVALSGHLLIGALVGLVVGLLGQVTPLELWQGHDAATLLGPAADLLRDSGFLKPGGGGSGPPPKDSFAIVFAIMILTIVLALLLSVLASMGAASVAGSMVTGAAEGFGSSIGVAIVIVLTRLWTTRVFMDRVQHRTHADLNVREEADAFVDTCTYIGEDSAHRRERIDAYFRWLEKEQIPLRASEVIDAFESYRRHCKAIRDWEPNIAAHFVGSMSASDDIEYEDVVSSFYTTDMSPPLTDEPSRDELLYEGWFLRSIRTGVTTGALTGVLIAIIEFITMGNAR